MKKLLFSLLLGIFLISLNFASADVIVSVNGTRPTFNLELIQSDGTYELSSGTNYYFQCIVSDRSYYGGAKSPASEEFNITTNSTHRWINISGIQEMCNSYVINATYEKGINCRWSANRSFKDWGGSGYMPWAFENNETGTGHLWTSATGRAVGSFICSNNAKYINLTSNILKTGDASYTSQYVMHPEISVPLSMRNRLEQNYNNTKGVMNIYVNGTNTWDNLLNAIANSGHADMCAMSKNSLSCLAQIYGDGIITIDGRSLTLMGGDNDNKNLQFTAGSHFYLDSWGSHWMQIYGNFTDTDFVTRAATNILDTGSIAVVKNLDICAIPYATHYQEYDEWGFRCMAYHQTRYPRNNDYAYNSKWYGAYEYVFPTYQNATFYYENDTFYNNGKTSYDVRIEMGFLENNSYNNFDMKNVISDRADKRLIFSYNAVAPANRRNIDINFTFHGDINFKIVDENGNAISGANVTLTNAYNTYSNTTTSNGEVTHDANFYRVYLDWSNPPNNASTLEMGLYNLTITAMGYEDYSTQVNLSEPEDWRIALADEKEEGGIVIYSPSERLPEAKDYPYINYEISQETSTHSGLLTNPYIIKKKTQ